jgi:mRNA interferase MazF
MVRFDPSEGTEYKKTRPAVLVNESTIGWGTLRIVVPITEWNKRYEILPWFVQLKPTARNGLTKESGADPAQVKSLSVTRLERKIGSVTASELEEIVAGVALCIGYEE